MASPEDTPSTIGRTGTKKVVGSRGDRSIRDFGDAPVETCKKFRRFGPCSDHIEGKRILSIVLCYAL